ncbi:MAG TPA: DUF4908 domain-containing protein [Caulobacteraceae bacterium]|jgi:hypothetical protein|nr:DUF4908 domain-containing protein [Caulobacteraceae bacterium]
MNSQSRAILALACVVLAALGSAQSVEAKPPSLGDYIFGARPKDPQRSNAPPVGRYIDDDGDISFVLDRSSTVTLMRFEDNPEIWVLTPQPGPHGDTIYKNDVGEPMLRSTWLGGLTIFARGHTGGAAASLLSEAPEIHPTMVLSPSALLLRLAQASARSARVVQRPVEFDAPDVTPLTASLVADAAGVASEAIILIAQNPHGRQVLSKLTKVLVVLGHRPSVNLAKGVLQIVVVPPAGRLPARDCIAGRPSSRRIAVTLIH